MHALVTGGAGFIGSNVARRLLAQHHRVTILDDFSSGYRENLDQLVGPEVVTGDIRDAALLVKCCRGKDVIFHLGASVGNKRSIEHPILDSDINVMGTLRVLEAARASGVAKVVVSSSAAIFGELKTLPIDESHPIDPQTPYGASKLGAEKLAIAYHRMFHLPVVCLRYFNVYGPHQRFDEYGNVIPIFAHQLLNGQPVTIFGDGEQTRDFVHVADVAEANLRAAESAACGIFNLGSGGRITINGLVDCLERAFGISAQRSYLPPRDGDVRHTQADIGLARRELGFEPQVKLDQGLADYARWLKSLTVAA